MWSMLVQVIKAAIWPLDPKETDPGRIEYGQFLEATGAPSRHEEETGNVTIVS